MQTPKMKIYPHICSGGNDEFPTCFTPVSCRNCKSCTWNRASAEINNMNKEWTPLAVEPDPWRRQSVLHKLHLVQSGLAASCGTDADGRGYCHHLHNAHTGAKARLMSCKRCSWCWAYLHILRFGSLHCTPFKSVCSLSAVPTPLTDNSADTKCVHCLAHTTHVCAHCCAN